MPCKNRAQQLAPVSPALGRLRKENHHETKTFLSYILSLSQLGLQRTTSGHPQSRRGLAGICTVHLQGFLCRLDYNLPVLTQKQLHWVDRISASLCYPMGARETLYSSDKSFTCLWAHVKDWLWLSPCPFHEMKLWVSLCFPVCKFLCRHWDPEDKLLDIMSCSVFRVMLYTFHGF